MATANSTQGYIALSQIYGNKNSDGTYTLNALDVKNLNDNLYSIASKIMGGLTTSDLTSATVDELKAGTVISNTVITNELYSDYGSISNLAVNKLRTDYAKATKFLNSDTSDVNYINIHDETISFITATVGSGTEQLTDGDRVFYWTDETHTQMTSEKTTDYPVTVYKYTELTKASIAFTSITLPDGTSSVMPVLTLGAGTGNGDVGKASIYKAADGLYLNYCSETDGKVKQILIGNDGVIITPYRLNSLDVYTNGFVAAYSADYVRMSWTLDGSGRIISLTDESGVTTPVAWHDTAM